MILVQKNSQVTIPIIRTFEKLYVCHSSSLMSDFLASADIKGFAQSYVGKAASYWP